MRKFRAGITYLFATTLLVVLATFMTMIAPEPTLARGLPLGRLNMPAGFKISVYARGMTGPRSMTLSSNGTLYVGSSDKVYAIPDADKDGKGDSVITLLNGLNDPNGVEFHNGSLYVGEINRITRYDNIDAQLTKAPAPQVVNKALPDNPHHGRKYIRFGPDGWLYVPVGAPCNICEPPDWRFASILRMKENGTGLELFSSGIRNTVGFDWHPQTKELWFTENGRDWLGDNSPPEEFNCAPKKGMHFGYPYCHGGDLPDPEFGKKRKCSEFTPPAMKLPAHHAPLGMKFCTSKMFPADFKNCAFICEHGSWNSSKRVGYRVSLVRFKDGKAVSYQKFIDGWEQPFGVWGRPVDVLFMADGSMLVSDDLAGAIYRITYGN
ncbi:MAG: PQQ-dependent sugar dehydrogenase [Candidatus Obscuribacterales bacterium]|nr:PQQ-dependent sugar dehydrogenase [Candidatus Obscuribacterales bacterium]